MSDYFSQQDILIEIFKKLSPKTLIRFTLVCKSWHALITSPSFIATHLSHTFSLNQTRKTRTLIIRNCLSDLHRIHLVDDNENGEANLHDPPHLLINLLPQTNGEDFVTVGVCNGVICLAAADNSVRLQTIILWNPSIQKCITLPPHIFKRSMERNLSFVGFGVVFSNGEYDYRVVRILFPLRKTLAETTYVPDVEVFSLRNRSWRKIKQTSVQGRALYSVSSQVLVNGVVHWIVFRPSIELNRGCPLIIAFNFSDEMLREMTLPDAYVRDFTGSGYLSNLWDCLGAVMYEPKRDKIFKVWVMKEYGNNDSWTLLYNFKSIIDVGFAAGFRKSGELFLSSRDRNQLVIYDPVSKVITKEFGINSSRISHHIGNYMQSLALLEYR